MLGYLVSTIHMTVQAISSVWSYLWRIQLRYLKFKLDQITHLGYTNDRKLPTVYNCQQSDSLLVELKTIFKPDPAIWLAKRFGQTAFHIDSLQTVCNKLPLAFQSWHAINQNTPNYKQLHATILN